MRCDKIILIGNLGRDPFLPMYDVICERLHDRRKSDLKIRNEATLTGGENVGGTTAAPAAPEVGDDEDGGGDPDPEPERRRPGRPRNTRKTCNTSPAGTLPAPSAAQAADALIQFVTRPAYSFVRLPVVCSLYAWKARIIKPWNSQVRQSKALTLGSRMAIANMSSEMGAKAGLVDPTGLGLWYPFEPTFADKDAESVRELTFDVSALRPQIAKPHSPENVVGIDEVLGTKVHYAFIGSCYQYKTQRPTCRGASVER